MLGQDNPSGIVITRHVEKTEVTYRYKAFISYSHTDKTAARGLHLRLETFRTPGNLAGSQGRWGDVEHKLTPVFRDRDELSTGSALGPVLQEALAGSEFLLVLCSPAAANSRWVNDEIRYFRSKHGDDHILAAIVDGDPAAPVGTGEAGCFPPALIEPPEGSSKPREPIAADFRKGGGGKQLAFLKVASGMLGVGLDDLVRRDAQRRQRQLTTIAAASFAGMLGAGWLAFTAYTQSIEANKQRVIAEHERDTATASLDFLVNIFEIANPATENPKTITALTILERGRNKIETELSGRPEVQAKLMGAMGNVYANLGEVDEAEKLFNITLAMPSLPLAERLSSKLSLAWLLYHRRQHEKARILVNEVQDALLSLSTETRQATEEKILLKGRALTIMAHIAAYGDFDKAKAIALYDDVRKTYMTSQKDQTLRLAQIDNNQGMEYANIGDHDSARKTLAAAYDKYRSVYGENHISSAETLHNIALSEFQAGRLEEAAQSEQKALIIFEDVLENNHPTIAAASLLLGRIKNALGDFSGSQSAMLKAAETYARAYGDDHEMVAVTLIYLSKYQSENKHTDEAFVSLAEAKRIYETLYPPDHANHGDLLVYSAIALNAANRKAEAIAACHEGLAIMEKSAAGDPAWMAENKTICEKIG
ncbi:MAG: toll/interleukin-1 receptor domain-containing protein [Alphaproteobacteria bacterium]|nr:toll/interleukin-1 receptor domain-containing protein [Alphaproteobacteria bacterium]